MKIHRVTARSSHANYIVFTIEDGTLVYAEKEFYTPSAATHIKMDPWGNVVNVRSVLGTWMK